MELNNILSEIIEKEPSRIVLSKPSKAAEYKRICISRMKDGWQAECFTEKQAFHVNLSESGLYSYAAEAARGYMQINAWTEDCEHIVLISKKGHISYKRKNSQQNAPAIKAHNRKKKYIIEEGTVIPPLVDMGIFTKEGKIVRTMYDKFRQINRFIELIDDSVRDRNYKSVNIIDFGCGKSYLTFIVYYYLTEIMGIKTDIVGLDLKADVIEECNRAAQRYGYSGLRFEIGDINGYRCEKKPDMVITLHACDTATDYALYNAVSWGAELIFSVPCCQHELNAQIKSDKLSILTRYGIIKERTAALMTDAVRGNLLQYMGYKTQLLEFVDMAHTPKNILIRAVKSEIPKSAREKALSEVKAISEEFCFEQTLYKLFAAENKDM